MTKEQIIAAIKVKLPKVNLSKKRLEAIAAKKIFEGVEEADIDAKIDELNEIMDFADLAKQDDTQRNLAAKLKAVEDQLNPEEAKKKEEEEKKQKQTIPTDVPDYVKALLEQQKAQGELLAKLFSEKQTTSISDKLKKDDRLKDVPAYVLELAGVPTEENYETFVENIVTKVTAAQAEGTNNNYQQVTKPIGNNTKQSNVDVKPAPKEEIKGIVSQIM